MRFSPRGYEITHHTVSVPMFQRRLRVDLELAEWLIDELVGQDVIAPGKGETFDVLIRAARTEGNDAKFEGRSA